MLRSDIMNELHDKNCLTNAGASEESDLSASGVRSNQIDHFDTGFQNLGGSLLLIEFRSRTMYRPELLISHRSWIVVNRLPKHVEHAPKALIANGNLD